MSISDKNSEQFLWTEKYRPKKIDDCILSNSLKKTFNDIIKQGEIPNMLFAGGAGTGKTTVAKALCNELNMDYLFINASEDSGIDVLRTKIRTFASSVSLVGNKKVVILDEADFLNANSFQPALRGFMEEFALNCRFILTCNFKNRIIEPIHSRCSIYEFKIENKDKQIIAASLLTRIGKILDEEKITYTPKVLAQLIIKHFPDIRKTMSELQKYSLSGTIDEGILINGGEAQLTQLNKMLKDKDFNSMRKWVSENQDNDFIKIFRRLYDGFNTSMKPDSLPRAILILAEYQYKAAFVADAELNLVACLTEIMSECEFS